MQNPMKFWLTMYTAAMTQAAAWSQFALKCWGESATQMIKLTEPLPHRRGVDAHASKPCAEGGPCLDAHYGRRHHDVNVEHI